MCEINIKKSILEVVKDNNLEILKIDLVNSDEAFARRYNEERDIFSCKVYTTLEDVNFEMDSTYWHDEILGTIYCQDKDTKEPVWIVSRGDIPEDECSSIWDNNNEVIGKEKGVSVYEAHKNINGTYSPVLPFPTNEKAFNDFIHHIEYFTGNKYLVTGDLLNETGTDGEPLIKNVKILKKL